MYNESVVECDECSNEIKDSENTYCEDCIDELKTEIKELKSEIKDLENRLSEYE